MKALRRLRRRWRGLPPARCDVDETLAWVACDDGARLATRLLRPSEPDLASGIVLVRSERAFGDSPVDGLARWLAEDGRTVLVQGCRGRGDSEGVFRPFASETDDARATLRWIDTEATLGGPLLLFGLGYSAFTAWAALRAAEELDREIAGIAVGFGSRDPYAWLHPGGVLQQETALALAARLDGRNGHEPDELDWERAGRWADTSSCDRVALRELPHFREWLAHPERDAFWQRLAVPEPESTLPTLLLGGWYDPSLEASLADVAPTAEDPAAPRLCIGPWGPTGLARAQRDRNAEVLGTLGTALLEFAAQSLGTHQRRPTPARVHVAGEGWREFSAWPPPTSETRTLYLDAADHANGVAGAGRLVAAAPEAAGQCSFVHDPAAPVPSAGGVSFSQACGPADLATVESRGDVLCFTSEPLAEPWVIVGRVRVFGVCRREPLERGELRATRRRGRRGAKPLARGRRSLCRCGGRSRRDRAGIGRGAGLCRRATPTARQWSFRPPLRARCPARARAPSDPLRRCPRIEAHGGSPRIVLSRRRVAERRPVGAPDPEAPNENGPAGKRHRARCIARVDFD